uniref:Uncharacterized protein n=1 Tax=Stomoxys calcitrans TaxID=35570 RepID=A0A1I8QDD0_STOCA
MESGTYNIDHQGKRRDAEESLLLESPKKRIKIEMPEVSKYYDLTGEDIIEIGTKAETIDLTAEDNNKPIDEENISEVGPSTSHLCTLNQEVISEDPLLDTTDCLDILLSPARLSLTEESSTNNEAMTIVASSTTTCTPTNVTSTLVATTETVAMTTNQEPSDVLLLYAAETLEISQKVQTIQRKTQPPKKLNKKVMLIIRNPPFFYTKPMHEVLGGFVNLTNISIPYNVQALLSAGSWYVPPNMPTLAEYIHQRRNSESSRQSDPSMYLREYLKSSYNQISDALIKHNSPAAGRLIRAMDNFDRIFENTPNLRLLKSECGKRTVVMRENEYHREMSNWMEKCIREGICVEVQNTNSLKKICHKKYQRLLWGLIQNNICALDAELPEPYPNEILEQLQEHNIPDAKFPCLYGRVSIPTENDILSPMVNTRGWYTYGLEKLSHYVLKRLLEPYIQKYFVRDLSRTASDIRNTEARNDYSYVKIKIDQLYTSVDQGAILAMIERLVNTTLFKESSSMDPKLVMEILRMRFKYMQVFTYGSKTYRQLKGLAQGAGDSQTLIGIMLCHLMNLHQYEILRYPCLSRIYMHHNEWLLYVSDDYINTLLCKVQHHFNFNRFSVVTERKMYVGWQQLHGILSFMDIKIIRAGGRFLTASHCPMQLTYSVHNLPHKWKNFLIQAHLRRVLERVSNAYLVNELYQVQHRFRDYCFGEVLVYTINHYLTIYQRIMNDRISASYLRNPICNFENMHERMDILCNFLHSNFPSTTILSNNRVLAKRRSNERIAGNCQEKRPRIEE